MGHIPGHRPGSDPLLTALAGVLQGTAPGVGRGIQRADQARAGAFQATSAALTNALGGLQRQRQAKAKADAARTKADKVDINLPNVRSIFADQVSRLASDETRLTKQKSDSGGTLPEDDQKLLDFSVNKRQELERNKQAFLSLANQVSGKGNNADKRAFLDLMGLSPEVNNPFGRNPNSFSGLADDIRKRALAEGADPKTVDQMIKVARVLFEGPKAAFERPFDISMIGGPEEEQPAAAGGPAAPTPIQGFPLPNEVIQNISKSTLDEARELGASPATGGRLGVQARTNQRSATITRGVNELIAIFEPNLPRIEDTSAREKKRRQSLRTEQLRSFLRPFVESQVDEAIEGGGLPPVDLSQGIQSPATGDAFPSLESLQGLPEPVIGDPTAALQVPITEAAPLQALAAPPATGELDFTTIATPGIRDAAVAFASREGASQDDLDTITDMMDALIEDEDLAFT